MSERILIVEDDASLRLSLQIALRGSGERYEVRIAKDGEEGLAMALAEKPALVLLDVMMPKMNGFEVLSELRRIDIDLPILLVTAKDSEEDRVRGLKLGADDYIVKPFGMAELLARIGAALRRRRHQNTIVAQISFGNVTIDFDAHEAKVSGALVEFTTLEFQLMRFFYENEGRVLSRERILAAVWGADYFGTARTVDNFVARLRAKLEPKPDAETKHFLTVRGGGYRFCK
jgi:two-component system, OmpR family, alkaline phosphatase synthesis response regulator PhoP